ncbi:hypothetical protein CEXT_451931 [Caerostris extrusa]|uniref:Uncharacterized protein n=1 Tax=Caerostris extrusa TaxID=172846 RepID=A0AAV4P7D7_CAEEX|nr:hypothetical protein CEXT_451931 [Caerostris extrusa]
MAPPGLEPETCRTERWPLCHQAHEKKNANVYSAAAFCDSLQKNIFNGDPPLSTAHGFESFSIKRIRSLAEMGSFVSSFISAECSTLPSVSFNVSPYLTNCVCLMWIPPSVYLRAFCQNSSFTHHFQGDVLFQCKDFCH